MPSCTLQKVLERALHTHCESCVFSACSQALQLLAAPDHSLTAGGAGGGGSGAGGGGGGGESAIESVYGLLSCRAHFAGITELRDEDEDEDDTAGTTTFHCYYYCCCCC